MLSYLSTRLSPLVKNERRINLSTYLSLSGMRGGQRFLTYLIYTKPKVWILLVFVAAVGAILAVGQPDSGGIYLVILAITAVTLGSAGAEGITNYIDSDIDAIMQRTRGRPLVTGAIPRSKGLFFGLILVLLSISILMIFGKFYASIFMILGVFDNVIIYSYLLKRRTPWSVVFGGFSGGFPVLIGWFTVTNDFSPVPLFLFALVVAWIPVHIWSIAYKYREDYASANVPMLPVVFKEETTAACISISAFFLVIFATLPYFFGTEPLYYLLVVSLLSLPLIYYSVKFIETPNKKSSFVLFKYSGPYLAFVFTLFLVFRMP